MPLEYAFDIGRIYKSRPLCEYAPSTQFTTTDWAYDEQRAELKLKLTPPTYMKPLYDLPDIEEQLVKARRLIFIGYSMADIDLEAIRLFRRAYHRHRSKAELLVEVVNRNQAVFEKLRAMYHESSVSKAADTVAEFAEGYLGTASWGIR